MVFIPSTCSRITSKVSSRITSRVSSRITSRVSSRIWGCAIWRVPHPRADSVVWLSHTSIVWPWSGAPKVRLYNTFLGSLHQGDRPKEALENMKAQHTNAPKLAAHASSNSVLGYNKDKECLLLLGSKACPPLHHPNSHSSQNEKMLEVRKHGMAQQLHCYPKQDHYWDCHDQPTHLPLVRIGLLNQMKKHHQGCHHYH